MDQVSYFKLIKSEVKYVFLHEVSEIDKKSEVEVKYIFFAWSIWWLAGWRRGRMGWEKTFSFKQIMIGDQENYIVL